MRGRPYFFLLSLVKKKPEEKKVRMRSAPAYGYPARTKRTRRQGKTPDLKPGTNASITNLPLRRKTRTLANI